MSGFYSSIEVSATGLSAERLAMDVIANNIANVNTTRTPEGGPFKRQLIVFAQKQDASSSNALDSLDGNSAAAQRAGVQAVGIVPDTVRTGWSTIPSIPTPTRTATSTTRMSTWSRKWST